MASIVTSDEYFLIEGQLGEIRRQLRQQIGYPYSLVDLRQALQAVIEGRFNYESVTSSLLEVTDDPVLAEIIAILGASKVLTAQQSAMAQGKLIVKPVLLVDVDFDVIRECAASNAAGETDWRFGFVQGFSLRQERDIFGTKGQPRFYNNDWWLGAREDEWAKVGIPSGYQLIDMKGRYQRTSYDDQSQQIDKLGSQYGRAYDQAVTEFAFGFFKAIGERLLENWYHWGRYSTSYGRRVCIGDFDSGGWFVGFNLPSLVDLGGLRVCLSRKFIKG